MTPPVIDASTFTRPLKPGGFLVIADHSAKPGAGTSVGKTLHRIEESVLRSEVEAAGFRLATSADFLRHPEDPRDERIFHLDWYRGGAP